MRFSPDQIVKGRLVRRYKRFLADVRLEDGTVITAHCPNSGSMRSCLAPGAPVILTRSLNSNRKLKYTLELIRISGSWIGINTARPNAIVEEAIRADKIPELTGYVSLRREVKYGAAGSSRIDLLLEDSRHPVCYVEVKNVTLLLPGETHAAFPDAVTERGLKHLYELTREVEGGNRAVILFLVQRSRVRGMRPADEIHPEYGAALRKAVSAGVEALAYQTDRSPKGIRLERPLPVLL